MSGTRAILKRASLTAKVRASLAVFFAVPLLAAMSGTMTPAPAGAAGTSPIQHVVVIYQENHTFDDALGAVCEQRAVPCNGYTGPVTLANKTTIPNTTQPDIVPNIVHSPPRGVLRHRR